MNREELFTKSNGFTRMHDAIGQALTFQSLRTQTHAGFKKSLKGAFGTPQSFSMGGTAKEFSATMSDFKPRFLESQVCTNEKFYGMSDGF